MAEMAFPSPLLAAGFDWLEAILPFAFVLIWIISQAAAVLRKAGGVEKRAAPRRPREPVVPQLDIARDAIAPDNVAPLGVDGQQELRQQIDAFLGRLIEQQQIERPEGTPTGGSRRRRPSEADQRARPRKRREGSRRAAPVPQGLSRRPAATTDVAEHVREVFSHEMAHLRRGLAENEGSVPPVPADAQAWTEAAGAPAPLLLRLLRSPATIRDAIVMREVLDRPIDRW